MLNIIKTIMILLVLASFSCKATATNSTKYDNTLCYAQAAYYEARDQGPIAMQLVMAATYNRVKDERWLPYACGVVWQRAQFSWTKSIGHRVSHIPKATEPADQRALRIARTLARSLRAGHWKPTISANHFLAPEGLSGGFPRWARCTAGLTAGNKCVSYKGQNVRAPDFTYAGIWFYTL